MNNPLISIVVPVYNAENYLDRCIESIIRQDYRNYELIIVDDGSSDESGKICDDWAKKDGRIRILHQQNHQGPSSARNAGIDIAYGEMISFIDADDYVTADYLSYLMNLFPHYTDCGIVACNHYIVRRGKERPNSRIGVGRKQFSRKEAFENVLFSGEIDVSAWAKMYRKEMFKNVKFPEGKLYEDTWVFGELLKQTNTVVFGQRCCYYYEMHKGSIVNGSFQEGDLEYIESAKKLAADAIECDPNAKSGAIRRINHARLSVLRKMENCQNSYNHIRTMLRQQVLEEAPLYIRDPRTPQRDHVAVFLLKLGMVPFYIGWKFYSIIR